MKEYKINKMAKFRRKQITQKRCSKCGAFKALDLFYRDKSTKDGRHSRCKACENVYTKEYDVAYSASPASYATYNPQLQPYLDDRGRSDPKNKKLLQVRCALCKKWFNPTNNEVRIRLNAINGTQAGDCNMYCSDACKAACPVFGQTTYRKGEKPTTNSSNDRPDQEQWRKHVIQCAEYKCAQCGVLLEEGGEAHHTQSVIRNPLESMDIDNGELLCKDCHKLRHSDIGCRPVDLRCAR